MSDEFCTSERKRSSLARMEVSASSFCSMVAPAMRMTNTRTKAPMIPSVSLWATDRNDGNHPCHTAIWPITMPSRLHRAVTLQVREPSCDTFSRATKAKAPVRTGPHPVR